MIINSSEVQVNGLIICLINKQQMRQVVPNALSKHMKQGWTIPAILYCNRILESWYCIGIATFSESSNSEYWAILENQNKWVMESKELNPFNVKCTKKIYIYK
jgi:hypothetical protein